MTAADSSDHNSGFIPLCVPQVSGSEWDYVKECLDTAWVSSVGSYVNRFEGMVADFLGIDHAVAVVNGTSALHLAFELAGIGPGDEVIVPTLSFIAPVNAVRYMRAEPVFMDCDHNLNMDPEKVAAFCEEECSFDGECLIDKQTKARVKAIVPVHIFGHPVNMDRIMDIAGRFNLRVIEDACESLGADYHSGHFAGKQTGTIGDIGCLSFNGNKIITAGGGGMIVTRDSRLAEKARYLSTQAKDDADHFIHHETGYNYRLSNVQAAIGCAQMEMLKGRIRTKRSNFEVYRKTLGNVPGLYWIKEPSYARSNYWFYTLMIEEEDYGMDARHLKLRLAEEKIETRLIWELNHRQKPFENARAYRIENALKYHTCCLNLPCSVSLGDTDIQRICGLVRGYRR